MPPSTFASDPGRGFGGALARLFGLITKAASDYQDFRTKGPDWRAVNRSEEVKRQEAEIAMRQHQAQLDYEPIKRRAGELANTTAGLSAADMLAQQDALALEGQDGVDQPVRPDLDPSAVTASGTSLDTIRLMGKGKQSGSALQRDLLKMQQRREQAIAAEDARRRRREEDLQPITIPDPAHPGRFITTTRGAMNATVTGEYGLEKQSRQPPPSPARGSFQAITDEKGNILTYFNPATGETSAPPVDGRKSGLAGTELTRRAGLEGMVEDLGTLADLANRHRDSIGRFSGTLAAIQRQTVGADPEVNDLFRLSDNLADQLLRARSGAQINEQEYKRLRSLAPNPRFPESKFFSDLKSFTFELRRLQARTSGGPTTPNPTRGGDAPNANRPQPHGTSIGRQPVGGGRYEHVDANGVHWFGDAVGKDEAP
ncbi:MAG TPA: hypothetical protein VN524_00920 [Hyphomicrobiaceae bacterium]|nr:hypothetical protein [Hyphomicrobiaceae bacterium]